MNLVRNTCFVLLMALEQDLTRALHTSISHVDQPLSEDERAKGTSRYIKDKGPQATLMDWRDLTDYLDLNEKLDVLVRNKDAVAVALGIDRAIVVRTVDEARRLGAIRNRVCHMRPLEEEDFPTVMDSAKLLLAEIPFPFESLAEDYRRIQENHYPLTIAIPNFWQYDNNDIIHNLPDPDFDDTGFIGRDQDRTNLRQLLIGPHPVITVTGEGGIGKTALTVRCLYDIAQQDTSPYEVILFGSLKTNRLTAGGVVQIVNAAADETEVLAPLIGMIDESRANGNRDELYDSIVSIMDSFAVLLVIDNIETIELAALRPLLIRIPRKSKVLLTSRRGLGEIEIRYPLDHMSQRDAMRLFRRLARLFNTEDLLRRPDDRVARICEALYFSPLLLRWFVEGYSGGKSETQLLNNPRSMSAVLDFCFDNVYKRFSDTQRELLRTLVAVPGPLAEVQLAHLGGIHAIDELRTELQYLYASNVVRRTGEANGSGESDLWTPTDFARRYVNTKHSLPIHERQRVRKDYQALIVARDEALLRFHNRQFSWNVIAAHSTDQAMVVRLLQNAQSEGVRGDFVKALEWTDRARALQPEFYEVWRVSAQIRDQSDDVAGAYDDFREALELCDPPTDPLLVFYARFLRKREDFDHALDVLRERACSGSGAPQLMAEYAWLHVILGRPAEGAELFRSIKPALAALAGKERAHYITQYASSLRRAAEADLMRGLPEVAGEHVGEALALIAEQLGHVAIDPSLVKEGQKSFQVFARAIATTCDKDLWEKCTHDLQKIAATFPLMGEIRSSTSQLESQCPEIAMTSTYRMITGMEKLDARAGIGGARWRGTLKEVFHARDFGFIAGFDGQEYFVHRSDFLGPGMWEDLWGKGRQSVEFSPAPQHSSGKSPRAYAVRLMPRES